MYLAMQQFAYTSITMDECNVLHSVIMATTAQGDFSAHCNLMGPSLYMWSIIDPNVVLWHITIVKYIFNEKFASYRKLKSCLISCV